LALVVLSVVEQRLDAVRAVLAGSDVDEVAPSVRVPRSTLHRWKVRYLFADPAIGRFDDPEAILGAEAGPPLSNKNVPSFTATLGVPGYQPSWCSGRVACRPQQKSRASKPSLSSISCARQLALSERHRYYLSPRIERISRPVSVMCQNLRPFVFVASTPGEKRSTTARAEAVGESNSLPFQGSVSTLTRLVLGSSRPSTRWPLKTLCTEIHSSAVEESTVFDSDGDRASTAPAGGPPS